MGLPSPINAADVILSGISTTVGTTIYFPVPCPGRIKDFAVVLGSALTTADETFTVSYAPPGSHTYTAVTGCAVTIPTASSAAGDTARAQLAPSTSAYVTDGGTIKIVPSGGGGAGTAVGYYLSIGP